MAYSLLTLRLVFPKGSRCFATLAIAENKKNFFTCFAYFYVFPYFRFFKLLPLLGLLAPILGYRLGRCFITCHWQVTPPAKGTKSLWNPYVYKQLYI